MGRAVRRRVNLDGVISSLRDGTAALASVPDLYLGTNETWSLAGGFALYDDGFGAAETGFGGGIQIRSSAEDPWSVGVSGALSGAMPSWKKTWYRIDIHQTYLYIIGKV